MGDKYTAKPTRKSCLDCVHIDIIWGLCGWGEQTPPYEGKWCCTKEHWDEERDFANKRNQIREHSRLAGLLEMANVCPDYREPLNVRG